MDGCWLLQPAFVIDYAALIVDSSTGSPDTVPIDNEENEDEFEYRLR